MIFFITSSPSDQLSPPRNARARSRQQLPNRKLHFALAALRSLPSRSACHSSHPWSLAQPPQPSTQTPFSIRAPALSSAALSSAAALSSSPASSSVTHASPALRACLTPIGFEAIVSELSSASRQ